MFPKLRSSFASFRVFSYIFPYLAVTAIVVELLALPPHKQKPISVTCRALLIFNARMFKHSIIDTNLCIDCQLDDAKAVVISPAGRLPQCHVSLFDPFEDIADSLLNITVLSGNSHYVAEAPKHSPSRALHNQIHFRLQINTNDSHS